MTIERFEDLARIFRKIVSTGGASCRPPPLGLSASAASGVQSRIEPWRAAAQESDLKLVTVSHQQLPSWIRTFNPPRPRLIGLAHPGRHLSRCSSTTR